MAVAAPGRPVIPALACVAPFVAGALLSPHAVESGPVLCPWRELTGLPCPLCGSVRAFTLLMPFLTEPPEAMTNRHLADLE